ncbi:unnamed protein product [Pleuronectes platessa]|uniref:Uncharacterized protein n=1 Tax=Pleuronectes platessa TaxID=8262 RepID=A0A9N7YZV7_PLEPL|nr:unnamed protein product [Pleuronectes platessa]
MVTIIACDVDIEVFTSDKMQICTLAWVSDPGSEQWAQVCLLPQPGHYRQGDVEQKGRLLGAASGYHVVDTPKISVSPAVDSLSQRQRQRQPAPVNTAPRSSALSLTCCLFVCPLTLLQMRSCRHPPLKPPRPLPKPTDLRSDGHVVWTARRLRARCLSGTLDCVVPAVMPPRCLCDDSLSITVRNITASLPKRQSAKG